MAMLLLDRYPTVSTRLDLSWSFNFQEKLEIIISNVVNLLYFTHSWFSSSNFHENIVLILPLLMLIGKYYSPYPLYLVMELFVLYTV